MHSQISNETSSSGRSKKSKKSPFSIILATLAVIIACLAIWYAMDVFLLAFAAILFSIVLNTVSRWIGEKSKLPYSIVLSGVVFVLIGGLTLLFWLSAPLIGEQMKMLLEVLPAAYTQLKTKASAYIDWSFFSKEKLASEFFINNEKILKQATAIFSFTFGTITSIIVFFLVGIYLAYSPQRYVKGFLAIFSSKRRKFIEGIVENTGKALRWWLLGKLIAMAIVGILTGIGLWILNIPLAFILGLLAALLTFIPYLGPILAAIPAILIGLTISPLKALYVIVLYVLIHAVEGYFISPYIDQKTVSLPPALTIMAQILFIVLIGFLGLVLASPLIVVSVVLLESRLTKT